MVTNYSLRSLFVLITILSAALAIAYYCRAGTSVTLTTPSGALCTVYTNDLCCDSMQPVYCDLKIDGEIVAARQWIHSISCSTRLHNEDYLLLECDRGEYIVLLSADTLQRTFPEDGVLFVFGVRNGVLHGGTRRLSSAARNELIDRCSLPRPVQK